MNLLRKFIATPAYDKFLFFIALALSFFVKIIVFTLPLRWYRRFLGQSGKNSPEYSSNRNKTIKSIVTAVNRCSRFAPWKTRCLVDAITAKLLLQWHGIPSTMFMGVNKDEEKKLIAHAWLKCGEVFITGKKGYQKFTVVSSFT
jgi:hypothetical protein